MNETQSQQASKFYQRQNRVIHKARTLLGMELDDCRNLARQIAGNASISALSIRQRWELIEVLKSKGATVYNPPLSQSGLSYDELNETSDSPGPRKSRPQVSPELIYPTYLGQWERRFPRDRPGFASSRQLAWIQALWDLDFTDGKGDIAGLRKFIFRQTRNLPDGPVSDLAFLRDVHVEAIITPLKIRASERRSNSGESDDIKRAK
ncbi:MAG: phage protein GemA/Gp16 family protein [Syntrophobacteraceae bacterium]